MWSRFTNAPRLALVTVALGGLVLLAGLHPTVLGQPLTYDWRTPKTSLLPPPRAADAKKGPGGEADQPARGDAHQVIVAWSETVGRVPDLERGGRAVPVIRGRMFLFGPTADHPLAGDGVVSVELFDETDELARLPVQRWAIDASRFDRLLRKDLIGWGYELLLPWATDKPGLAKARLRLRYRPVRGKQLSHDSSPFTLTDNGVSTKGR